MGVKCCVMPQCVTRVLLGEGGDDWEDGDWSDLGGQGEAKDYRPCFGRRGEEV